MTVDKEKLISLLADKTGMPSAEVEKQLEDLLQHIGEAAGRGESYEIEGFGSFSTGEEGLLTFSPSKKLETEVNHRYAGMKPIELIGAFKESPEEESEAAADEKESTESDVEEFIVESPESEAPDISESIPEQEVPQEKSASMDSSFIFDEESEKREKEAETPPPAVTAPAAAGKATAGERESAGDDPIGKFLIAAVMVITLGATGWLVYDMGLLDFSGTSSDKGQAAATSAASGRVQMTQSGEEESSVAPPTGGKPPQKKEGAEQKELNPIQENEAVDIAEQSRQSIYGLRGGAVPEARSGYTIVVHSLQNESKARSLNQSLKSEGYITILADAVVQGARYWRVGLGQFKTVSDAREAVERLPKAYRENHFIKRIQ